MARRKSKPKEKIAPANTNYVRLPNGFKAALNAALKRRGNNHISYQPNRLSNKLK